MKISKYLALALLVISLTPVWGQPAGVNFIGGQLATEATNLTKFNLDFPGGTPAELVKAIEKATGKPLNVIIPEEDANTQLPPLKMNDVVTPQLFTALEQASVKQVAVVTSFGGGRNGPSSYSTFNIGYGFKTVGEASDNSIWYFHVEKPSLPPGVSTDPPQHICQFYSLTPYLDRGFTVDDITTAIQTGWKMAGITSPPELNYHKETKLLIAFGDLNELHTIEQVLQTLPQTEYSLPTLSYQIGQLQGQIKTLDQNFNILNKEVGELNNKISGKATNAAPEEKSGK